MTPMVRGTVYVALFLGFWTGLSLSSVARAQTTASLSAERIVQEHLGIFQVVDELLDPLERVEHREKEITIWYRTRIDSKNKDEKLCSGARWLIAGRLGGSTGARKLFQRNPDIESLTLIFFDVSTSVRLGKNNRYKQSRRPVDLMRFSLKRSRGLNIDPARAKDALAGRACVAVANRTLNKVTVTLP